MNALWKGQPIVASQADRWSIVPRIGEAPRIDGSLDEAAWSEAARMSGFRSFYANEPTGVQTDTEIRLACDDRHLFIGIIGFAGSDGHPAAEKIDILLSTPDQPDRYYNIPIEISRGPRDFTAAYGPGMMSPHTPVISAVRKERDHWTAEAAVPIASMGMGGELPAGAEWRINVVRYYGIAAPRPSSSLIPVRHSSITDLGKPDEGYSMRIDLLQEGRMGSLYWQRPPLPDNAQQVGRWTPERAILTYGSFTEKLLHVEPDEISDCFSLNMMWRTPSNKQIEISEFEFVPAAGIIAFTHPKPLEPGLYQLQITVADNTQAAKMAVLTFDREALIDAGESLYVPPQAAGRIQVTAAAPSEHVTRLLNIIPEQPGVIFGGDPERPDLYAGNKLFSYDMNDPFALVSVWTGTRYPNDRFPETQSFAVTNRKGETVRFPYYEDAAGKRYLLTALLWYEQKMYALKETRLLASKDPLGTARLLNRWADAYAGWVPTNDYPWGCYPTEVNAGPPYHYWGGVWSRWSTSDLGDLRNLAEAYAEVKKTNAFEVLSGELGVDVDNKIVEEMFRPSFEFFDSFPNGNHNNDYHNWIGLMALSKALGHPRYFHQALERIQSFVSGRFLFDGFFSEVCVSYHTQSTGGLQAAMDAAKGWSDPEGYVSPRSGRRVDGLDMENVYPALQAFNRIVSKIVYPSGTYFPIQDTWAFSKSRTPGPDGDSLLLPAAGIARLTRGALDRQQQLYMSFVPKYGHDHLDPLNLALFACGQELLPDIGYTHTLYRQWTRSTLCHNTVVVDGKDMDRASGAHGGNVQLFVPGPQDVQVMQASQENAYPGLRTYSREVWMIGCGGSGVSGNEGYAVDLFRVYGGTRHEYTLNGDANRDSEMEANVPLSDYGPYLLPEQTRVTLPTAEQEQGDAEGEYYGYMYVQDVRRADIPDGSYEVVLRTAGGASLKLTGFTGSGGTELFIGQAPSLRATRLNDKSADNNAEAVRYRMPKLVVRREGNDLHSHFVHVMEPYSDGDDPRIQRVELLQPERSGEGDVAVAVTYCTTTDIILSSPFHQEQPLVVGDMMLTGKFGFIRIVNGEVTQMRLIGGTSLRKGDTVITGSGSVEGVVDQVLRKADGDAYDALVTRQIVPDEALGSYAIVIHPDQSTNGYRIRDVIREGGRTLLSLDQTDPGFVIHGDGSSEMKFYPFKKWNGLHRFRIDNVVQFR
jgi:hypothetical protein